MSTRDPRVDAYIAKSADFAKPILTQLRESVHEHCPKRREYVEWLTEAKTDATREKRLATSIEWLSAGKARYWKYEKC